MKDIIMSFDVFEHIPDSNEHISEVRRVLKTHVHYLICNQNKFINMSLEIVKNRSLTNHKTYHCFLQTFWSLKKTLNAHNFEFKFEIIPVMNEFMVQNVKKVFARIGVCLLWVVNPDRLPLLMWMNFYVCGVRK